VTPALLLSLWALFAPADGPLVVSVSPAAQRGCPADTDVEAALRALLRPGALVPFDSAAAAAGGVHRLTVTLEPHGATASRLRLTDGAGGVKLERWLTISEGEGTKDCAALAQTAALIVDRYLVELDYKPPAPPPPPPAPPALGRWELASSGAWVPGRSGLGAFEVGGRVGRQMGGARRFVVTLGVRVTGQRNPLPSGSPYRGQAVQRSLPVDLGLWWRTPLWRNELRAGGGGALEISRTRSEGDPGRVATRLLAGPAAWLGGAIHRPFLRRGFVSLSAALVGSLVQYDFSYRLPGSPADVTAFTTPPRRFYGRMALDLGFVLP
jgi:hypothetical protein